MSKQTRLSRRQRHLVDKVLTPIARRKAQEQQQRSTSKRLQK